MSESWLQSAERQGLAMLRSSWCEPGCGERADTLLGWIGGRLIAANDLAARRTDLRIVAPGPPEEYDLVRAVEALSRVGVF